MNKNLKKMNILYAAFNNDIVMNVVMDTLVSFVSNQIVLSSDTVDNFDEVFDMVSVNGEDYYDYIKYRECVDNNSELFDFSDTSSYIASPDDLFDRDKIVYTIRLCFNGLYDYIACGFYGRNADDRPELSSDLCLVILHISHLNSKRLSYLD